MTIVTFIIWLSAFGSAAIWLWLIRRYDMARPEPIRVMLRIGLIGGAISVFIVGIGNALYMALTGTPDQPVTVFSAVMLASFVGLNEEF